MGLPALGGVGGRGSRGWRREGSGIPEEGSDITAEAFPQMRPCRAGLREHKEFVKSAALFTFKIKNGEEEISNSDRRRGKGRRQKKSVASLTLVWLHQNTLHLFFFFF